jgi:hypothetical protein
MDIIVASILMAAFLVLVVLLAGCAPSLRHAIRQTAPEFEEDYFSPAPGRRLQFGGLRLLATFAQPRSELARSAEFRASLRLVRSLVIAGLVCAAGLVVSTLFL